MDEWLATESLQDVSVSAEQQPSASSSSAVTLAPYRLMHTGSRLSISSVTESQRSVGNHPAHSGFGEFDVDVVVYSRSEVDTGAVVPVAGDVRAPAGGDDGADAAELLEEEYQVLFKALGTAQAMSTRCQIWGLLLSLPTAPSLVRSLHDCTTFDWEGKLAPCSRETVALDPAAPWQRLYTLQAVAGQLRESLHAGAAGPRRSTSGDRWDARFISSGALVYVVAHLDTLLQGEPATAANEAAAESKAGASVADNASELKMTGLDHRQLFLPTIAAVTRIVVFCVPNVRGRAEGGRGALVLRCLRRSRLSPPSCVIVCDDAHSYA